MFLVMNSRSIMQHILSHSGSLLIVWNVALNWLLNSGMGLTRILLIDYLLLLAWLLLVDYLLLLDRDLLILLHRNALLLLMVHLLLLLLGNT